MSADNWTNCELCDYRLKKELADLEKQSDVLTKKAYDLRREEIMNDLGPVDDCGGKTPLREDREYGVGSDGKAYCIYSGVCQRCAASWQIKTDGVMPENKEDKKLVEEMNNA